MNHSERVICAQPLSREAFAEFGEVIDTDWPNHFPINNGKCVRYDALATVDTVGAEALAVISIFRSSPCDLPYQLEMVERHPLGSQAFVPLTPRPFSSSSAPTRAVSLGSPGRSLPLLVRA
jgi:ureidoglycolate lyase